MNKPIWQMRMVDFVRQTPDNQGRFGQLRDQHMFAVIAAIKSGEQVPDDVMANYRDLTVTHYWVEGRCACGEMRHPAIPAAAKKTAQPELVTCKECGFYLKRGYDIGGQPLPRFL